MTDKVLKIYKDGQWFHCYKDDALIISYLTGYKLYTDAKTNDDTVGFSNPSKVLKKLNQYEIDYDFIDYKNKKTFLHNHYNDILKKSIENFYYRRKTLNNALNIEKKKTYNANQPFYREKGSLEVKPNTSVTIKNINTNQIETYNIVELKYHMEPRFADAPMFSSEHIKYIKVYDESFDFERDEISIESELGMSIKNHREGFKFYFRGDTWEIIKINKYYK